MKAACNPVYPIILVRTLQASVLALALHRLCHWPLTGPHALGLFLTPLLCCYFVFVFVAPWSWYLSIVTRLRTEEKVVALTFDDGPAPETTPRVLDILSDFGVTATFFVLGEAVEDHPELFRRIVQEGHEVGLHGYDHRALALISVPVLGQEAVRAAEAVQKACPGLARPTLFRPPHGFKSLTMPWSLRRLGYRLVLWSLNPRDYRAQTAEQMTRTIRAGLHPGAIVLLHDGPDNVRTVQTLPAILHDLTKAGYRCVSLHALRVND